MFQWAKGLRMFARVIATAFKELLKVVLLFLLFLLVFSLFGMSLFKDVAIKPGMDELFNFQTFGASMILLFQVLIPMGVQHFTIVFR